MQITEMRQWLQSRGFIVGARNPRVNTKFTGCFMVSEYIPEVSTVDAANGPWAIVGDDLNALIKEAYETMAGGGE